jgi:hypothetical protein
MVEAVKGIAIDKVIIAEIKKKKKARESMTKQRIETFVKICCTFEIDWDNDFS